MFLLSQCGLHQQGRSKQERFGTQVKTDYQAPCRLCGTPSTTLTKPPSEDSRDDKKGLISYWCLKGNQAQLMSTQRELVPLHLLSQSYTYSVRAPLQIKSLPPPGNHKFPTSPIFGLSSLHSLGAATPLAIPPSLQCRVWAFALHSLCKNPADVRRLHAVPYSPFAWWLHGSAPQPEHICHREGQQSLPTLPRHQAVHTPWAAGGQTLRLQPLPCDVPGRLLQHMLGTSHHCAEATGPICSPLQGNHHTSSWFSSSVPCASSLVNT